MLEINKLSNIQIVKVLELSLLQYLMDEEPLQVFKNILI